MMNEKRKLGEFFHQMEKAEQINFAKFNPFLNCYKLNYTNVSKVVTH